MIKQSLAERAKEEAQQKRPLYGFFELSLLQPRVLVSNQRKDYHCDVTSHVSAYVRLFFDKDPDITQAWIGLRLAPFGGYGIQKNFSGRFAMTFIGPAIGFGRISKPSDPLSDSPARSLWLWSAGVAGVNKLVSSQDSVSHAPSDFKSSAWAYEAPGVWSEIRWTQITHGALGIGTFLGAQMAKGKNFIYFGITGSGFY